jgi:hypothetical protein
MVEGFGLKGNSNHGLFCKTYKGGRVLNRMGKKRRGLRAKLPFFFLPSPRETEEGWGGLGRPPNPAALGPNRLGRVGEKGEEEEGVRFPALPRAGVA